MLSLPDAGSCLVVDLSSFACPEVILLVCSTDVPLYALVYCYLDYFFYGLMSGWSCPSGPETAAHLIGIILLIFSVSIPPVTRNFSIP
ncbi:hypothetical protein Tco_0944385 [Tanacetum coccineum]